MSADLELPRCAETATGSHGTARCFRAALLLPLVLMSCSETPRQEQPNVVIVVSDALRAANLSLYGYPRETAPHLTELARGSIVMQHHFVNAAATPISVSQMQTGLLAPPLLMDATPNQVPVRAIQDDMLVLPRWARQRGYRTGLVSAHPWFNERARLLEHFEYVHLAPYDATRAYASFSDLFPAIEAFLRSAARSPEPFLLYVHILDTHRPFDETSPQQFSGTEGWPDDYDEYDSEIYRVDHWTHQLVLRLQELGEWHNTLFVFTSDHGEEHFEMGPENWHGNHGQSVSRAAVHVPLIIRLPHSTPDSGRRIPQLTQHIDLAPTLVRLIDDEVDLDAFRLDGTDLGHLLRGEGNSGSELSVVRAFRYWGLHDLDGSLEYDSWSSTLRSVAYRADEFNYPRPVECELDSSVSLEDIVRRTRFITKQFEDLPPVRPPAFSIIAIPFEAGSAATPTRIDDIHDQRWNHPGEQLLQCGPDETPRADLYFPWSPGRYRVRIMTSGEYRMNGYRNRLRVEMNRNGRPFDAPGPDENGLIDLGQHSLGAMVRISVQARRGGVALTGLLIEASDGGETSNRPSEELERQLKALGYL